MSRCEQRPAHTADQGQGQGQPPRRHRRTGQRGAAMIVAIAIFAILLAIALTFYSVSRTEFDTSTNVINSVRSDLQADGAIAQAIAHLNEDFLRNHGATSTDHSWRSFFNGAWAAGKPWLMQNGQAMHNKGLPAVNLHRIEQIVGASLGPPEANLQLIAQFPDGRRERLFRGPITRAWLHIPRLQRNDIVLYDNVNIVYPARNGNQIIDVLLFDGATDLINPALASAGRPERFGYFIPDDNIPGHASQAHPFVTSDYYGTVIDPTTFGAAFPIPTTDPDGLQYPLEQIHTWADIDNDGDSLRDAVWFPMQADQFFPGDGVDNDLDGWADETQDNGIDDDSDGSADLDASHASVADPAEIYRPLGANPVFDVDESVEGAPFLYHGLGPIDPETDTRSGDGLDNDGRNGVDDANENKLFLTSPLPGMRIQIDMNNDGLLNEDDLVLDPVSAANRPVPVYIVIPNSFDISYREVNNTNIFQTVTAADVDVLDNDHDGEVNESDAYAYIGPHSDAVDRGFPPAARPYDRWEPFGNWGAESAAYSNAHERGYVEINVDTYLRDSRGNLDIVPGGIPPQFGVTNGTNFLQQFNAVRVTLSGEPVCKLVGRAAVYVADESAKINANVAHALTYRDQPFDTTATGGFAEGLLQRALSSGSGPAEIDLRVLPGIGIALSQRIAGARYGGPDGLTISSDRGIAGILDGGDPLVPYYYDVSLPGYGRVDDNANSLVLGLDRRNSNGDQYGGGFGLQDEGTFLPRLSALATNALVAGGFDTLTTAEQDRVLDELRTTRFDEYYSRLGVFEGIDEPEEFRRFRGIRNLIAERNALDLDGDDVAGEIGELGDAAFQSFDQIIARVDGIGTGIGARLRPLLGVHSTDRNVTFFDADDGLRALSRIDYNFAPAAQIAGQLLLTGADTPVTDRNGVGYEQPFDPNGNRNPYDSIHNTTAFAEGLRQADTTFTRPNNGVRLLADATTDSIPADPILQTLLAAASIVDNRDPGHARTLLRTEDRDLLPGVVDNRRYSTPDYPAFAAWPPSKEAIPVRDRIADGELMPMEEIEEFLRTPLAIQDERAEIVRIAGEPNLVDNSTTEGLRRLQSLDAWWANFVRADITTDTRLTGLVSEGGTELDPTIAPIAEQRTISFAAAGAEAIRINELMVRPVRRVEAEMVNFVPGDATTYPLANDPLSALVDSVVADTEFRLNTMSPTPWDLVDDVQHPLPVFDVGRSLSAAIELNFPLPSDPIVPIATAGQWEIARDYLRDGSGLMALGNTAGLAQSTNALGEPVTDLAATLGVGPEFPNAVEFSFAGDALADERNGLPSGRYYLTMNIADANGVPTVSPEPQATNFAPFDNVNPDNDASIYYSIKYVYQPPPSGFPESSPGVPDANYVAANRSILEDMALTYSDALVNSNDNYEDYIHTFWNGVAPEFFSRGGLGEARGWVFLDGTPNKIYSGGTFPPGGAPYAAYPPANAIRPGAYFAEFSDNLAIEPYLTYGPDYGNPFPLYDFDNENIIDPVALPLGIYPGGLTHTVYVPPAGTNWRLHVAVYSPEIDPVTGDGITVNFFDFSQEPDHEYIELTNIADEPVDLSGWELEIGIPEHVDPATGSTLADPFASKWQVPNGTQIAPGGFLLLGFNKFDQFQTDRPLLGDVDAAGGGSYFENNGIGLARGFDVRDDLLPVIGDVTEPPLRGFVPLLAGDLLDTLLNSTAAPTGVAAGQLTTGVSYASLFSDTYFSVFRREDDPNTAKDEYTDFIDNDGDGVSSAYLADQINTAAQQTFNLDTDNSVADTQLASAFGAPNRPWDRIVALNCLQLGTEPRSLGGAINAYDFVPYTLADINASDGSDIDKLARVILRGGVLPNYPEHDGIDNDGDGATATNFVYDGITPSVEGISGLDFYPGSLDRDMIDNNLDGFADVVQVAADLDGLDGVLTHGGYTDLLGALIPAVRELPDPFASEGVDEGGNDIRFANLIESYLSPPGSIADIRERRYGAAGTFERPPLPVLFFADRYEQSNQFGIVQGSVVSPNQILELNNLLGPGGILKAWDDDTVTDITTPGLRPAFTFDVRPLGNAYNAKLVAFLGVDTDPDYGGLIKGPKNPVDASGAALSGNAPYLGTRDDNPEWRAFVERRWNPGDNVIVTLYQGRAVTKAVADRVTYREYDVINRTLDDGFESPYEVLVPNTTTGVLESAGIAARLNPDLPSMWSPDHMGLDFYRALERKDPRYAGDRFGTRNRWEATDGNYDDWAESLSFASPIINGNGTINALPSAGEEPSWRFDTENPVTNFEAAKNRRLFGHAFFGSPLRMNTAARIAQNPADLAALLDDATAVTRKPFAGDAIAGRPYTQFESLDAFNIVGLPVDPTDPLRNVVRNFDWTNRKTFVANRPFESIAGLARVPLATYENVLTNSIANGFLLPRTNVNARYALDDSFGSNYRLDPAFRGSVLGFDERDGDNRANLLAQASANLATDALTLTVGQADFRPILPDSGELTSTFGGILDWESVATGQLPIRAWTPVTLFELPGDNLTYPAYPNGVVSGAVVNPFYLFNIAFLTNRAAAPHGDIFGLNALTALNNGTIDLTGIAARWPAPQRAVAYVARAPIGDAPNLRPQGVWSWDADDGLENGEYTLYIGTFLPGISERLGGIQALLSSITGINQDGVNITPYPETLLTGDALDFLNLDPSNTTNTGTVFEPRFTFEIITEPTLAQGQALARANVPNFQETQVQPGLTHPDDWYNTATAVDAVAQEPRSDGYILYGSSANGAWRPQRVRVTKNFLAIRIRQEGVAGECAIFTHVVLSPRKRTAGRINLNTAENRVVLQDGGGARELFNPLLGVPGVLDVLTTTRGVGGGLLGVPISDNDNIDPVTVAGAGPWPAPDLFTTWNDNGRTLHPVPPFVFQPGSDNRGPFGVDIVFDRLADSRPADTDIPADEASALRLSSLLMAGRTQHPDGRYYENLGDLMRQSSNFESSTGRFWPSYNAAPYDPYPFAGAYDPDTIGLRDFLATEAQRLSPLTNAPRSQDRYDEAIARLRRMSNSLTTRSDVFEIVVTVQSGYGIDTNGDGAINYRTSDEFITTGEKAARMVYERRAPADRTDEPDLGND